MIRTEQEFNRALEQLEREREALEQQRNRLSEMGIEGKDLERAMQPAISFHDQLREEVETYERIKRGEFEPLFNLTHIGRWLIGARIALGMTQRELAERLEVSESVVSRDERNDYHGVSVERAQRILEALGIRVRMEVEEPVVSAA